MEKIDYKQFARELRRTVLMMTHKAQSSHIGSNFSCADILSVLYNIADLSLLPDGMTKDIVIVKSWAAASVYACLVAKGLLPQEAIDDYGKEGTPWTTILEPIKPHISVGTGAMGYHLPFAVGFALAKKVKKELGTVYCLISDGECQIGSTWESALLAAHHKLDNLVLIIDRNGLQAMGEMKDILDVEPLADKFRAFRWGVEVVDGHNFEEIEESLKQKEDFGSLKRFEDGSIGGNFSKPIKHILPRVIIANTIKGKGVSFMENDNLWHYSHVNRETLDKALEELQ